MTKKEYKGYQKLAKEVMECEMGFSPSIDNIVLLETSRNQVRIDYVRFRVRRNENIEYVISTSKGWTNSGYELRVENSSLDSIQMNA